jgi:hypothetical protein
MRQGSEPMEHHGGELDHQNEGDKEHEHEHENYRLQMQVFLGYQHLEVKYLVEITECPSYNAIF